MLTNDSLAASLGRGGVLATSVLFHDPKKRYLLLYASISEDLQSPRFGSK